MKHPTKEGFIAALRHAVHQLEAELAIPEDPDEIETLDKDGIMPQLAAWMMREMYAWGWNAGYAEAAVKSPCKPPTTMQAPEAKHLQSGLFSEGDDE